MRIAAVAVIVLGLAAPCAAIAKNGDVSRAKTLFIQKLAAVRISGLHDLVFPPSVEVPPAQETPVCIFSSDAGRYTVLARGQSSDGFWLRSRRHRIPYTVSWFDSAQGGTGAELQAGAPSALFQGADRENETCNGATNARLHLALDSVGFAQVPPNVYTDTLTLLVSPD